MNRRAYPEGYDWVWIGSDCRGSLAAFVTAGEGPMPIQALNSELPLFENVEEAIFRLPPVSKARLLESMPRPDSFTAMAERGFFVYDWRAVHRTAKANKYEQVAIPLSPIRSRQLPELLAQLAQEVRFSNLVFEDTRTLDVRTHFDCCEAVSQ